MRNILITTARKNIAQSLSTFLREGNAADVCSDLEQTIRQLKTKVYNVLFLELDGHISGGSPTECTKTYKSVLSKFWDIQPTLEIVVMVDRDHVRQAVMAVQAGANNYLTYPLNNEAINLLLSGIYEDRVLYSELAHLRDRFWALEAEEDISTQSPLMKTVLDQVKTVAPTRSTVLLTGETGTGKSRMAKLIHAHSSRKSGPFISVNCGAIPDSLVESELFGHERGAFTGAVKLKLGRFEIAKGGTLFLDEIGTISPAAQIRLLNVIQDSEFQRVGGENLIKADIRLIAATNSQLLDLVGKGVFRKDLYYRLNVFPITIPALSERKEDIATIVDGLIRRFNLENAKEIRGIQPDVLSALQAYDWPGNIRELENLIERAYILETTDNLHASSFPREIFHQKNKDFASSVVTFSGSLADVRSKAANEAENDYLRQLLQKNKGRISLSAETAGISTRQLSKLLQKHRIKKEDYKK